MKSKILAVSLAVVLLLALIPVMAFAQDDPTGDGLARQHPLRALLDAAAEALGLEPSALLEALRGGSTPAELAAEAGVSNDVLNSRLQEAWNAAGAAQIERFLNQSGPGRMMHFGFGKMGMRGGGLHMAAVAAEAIGIDTTAFVTALSEGQTPAQIAEANGSSADAIVSTLIAAHSEQLQAAVEAGRITQEQADAHLAAMTTRISEWVETGAGDCGLGMGKPGRGLHMRGFGGRGLDSGADSGVSFPGMRGNLVRPVF